MKTTVHVEARKNEARERFAKRMEDARRRTDLTPEALDAYLDGLRDGYGQGLSDGVHLGYEAGEEAARSFNAPGVGVA